MMRDAARADMVSANTECWAIVNGTRLGTGNFSVPNRGHAFLVSARVMVGSH